MQIIEKHSFVCPVCNGEYKTREKAEKCMNSSDKPIVEVGAIVEVKYGYGWFDGDKKWVINPDVDTSKRGFSKDCSMGFYYVVTHIEFENHRCKYHLFTNAMTGKNGHREGYTYNTGHYTPKPIDATEHVKNDAKKLIGQKSDYLL